MLKRGVLHYGLAIYIKRYLKAKKKYENSNISPCKTIIFKKSSKKTKILQDIKLCNSSQVSTQAKISSFKNPHIKIDLLPWDQNPLSYYILYNESKHNILALVGKPNKFVSS